jgi:hypothetical protein
MYMSLVLNVGSGSNKKANCIMYEFSYLRLLNI